MGPGGTGQMQEQLYDRLRQKPTEQPELEAMWELAAQGAERWSAIGFRSRR